jgi:hypothetical protein
MSVPDGLDNSAEAFLGELLEFAPRYGYGWHEEGGTPAETPRWFRVRLAWLWSCRGTRRGGVARIQMPGHHCDGMWLVFETRHDGIYNFTTAPGDYNVTVNFHEPTGDIGDLVPYRQAGDPNVFLEGWGCLTAAAPPVAARSGPQADGAG